MNSRNGQYQEAYQFLGKKREEIIGWVRVGVDSACQVELYINAIQELIDLLEGAVEGKGSYKYSIEENNRFLKSIYLVYLLSIY
jgi:hypothetical protein